MQRLILWLCAIGLLPLTACCFERPSSRPTRADLPGQQLDGAIKLPNQWYLRPVGKQVVLGDFPVNIAVHPSGKFAAVLHCGFGQQEITIVEIPGGKLISRADINESFYGLAFSPDGKRVICSGAGDETVHSFAFANGYLYDPQTIKLRESKYRAIPAGLCMSGDGKTLWVANLWGHRVTEVDLAAAKPKGDILIGTNALMIFEEKKTDDKKSEEKKTEEKTTQSEDEAAILKRAEALLDQTESADPFPYGCVVDEKRRRLYVSLWAQAAIAVIDLEKGEVIERWATQEHPNELLLAKSGKHLFVANANRNTVSVLDTDSGRTVETLLAELLPNSPPGNTPNSLALSPNEKTLFVANANINTVAVFDVSEIGKSHSLGFIPVGWYPTSVRVTPDGKHLLVTNGKGILPKANRHGPQPIKGPPASVHEYIAGLLQGTLSIIELTNRSRFEDQMKRYTARAYRCLPAHDVASTSVPDSEEETSPAPEPSEKPPGRGASATVRSERNPIPLKIGDPSPIKYVFYVVKENRTYDQVLGDLPEGNGDSGLCIFPDRVTPNHHKLAREFVLLDNFYVESEVSADGHEWTMGAYATDFVEKSWPLGYGHNKHKKYPYPAEGNFLIATPAGGYLWDRAREAGVSYRSYGEFVANGKTTNAPCISKLPALKGHFDPWYRSFDTEYMDVRRVERFASELKRFEREGDMPRLQVVRLPNDHTSGSATNKPTPTAQLGDNDLAFGTFVDAISHSKFWPQTAIFVVEDDAQNGPDHVDAHRTIAFVISPYTKHHAVDSTMYSTSSMLRTMELILGLRPMSQFDALALPMFNSFQAKPDLRPYKALPARVDLQEKNQKRAWGSALSAKMDFSKEDAADDLVLNEIIWRSVKGPTHAMPSPTRAAFVFPHGKDGDDD